ncbi:MAG TPA: glycosyltransferase [Solirubrobacteraceae bacterium]|nr:glycosyltransferase [Solirubrobacteraceae bacterium]
MRHQHEVSPVALSAEAYSQPLVRALFTTIPAFGHFSPLVPLAAAMQDAGHEVAVATAESFGGSVSRAGLEFIPAGVDMAEAMSTLRDLHPEYATLSPEELSRRVVPDFFVGVYAPAFLADASRLLSWRPDVVVREEGEFAGPAVAALANVPCVDHGWGGPRRPRELVDAAARALEPVFKSVGLDPLPSGGAYQWLYLEPCPPSLQPADADEVPGARPIRPCSPPSRSAQGTPEWLDRLGDRVVYITLGTVPFFTADIEFFRAAIAAARDEAAEVVVTVGPAGDPSVLDPQPENVHVERYLPQAEVLPHCAVVVSNGGSGSTLGALSAGVPLMIIPSSSPSQLRNARAVAATGIGRTLDRADVTVDRLGAELHALLHDSSYRVAAERVAAEIATMPPPEEVVGLIESLTEPAGQ